ncbi:MAG: right-handed parallel beta-helix repeat-containing protein [Lentisphaeria bacterium]|nr:right-handed parallel beta-helix repeat-containing protein [Lentisphaeria bacterium]
MLKRLLLMLLCAAVYTAVCDSGSVPEIIKPAGKNLWTSSGVNSAKVYYVCDEQDGLTFEYDLSGAGTGWTQVDDISYGSKEINGNTVSCYIININNIIDKVKDRRGYKSHKTLNFNIKNDGKTVASGSFIRPEPDRLKLVRPAKMGELKLVPTFNSCGIYYGTVKRAGFSVEYKKSSDSKWLKAFTPHFFTESDGKKLMSEYRGSIVKLEENTQYDVRVLDGKKVLKKGKFTTWKTDVPIAKTIYIDTENFKAPYVISAKGTPDGWIRYTTKDGKKLVNKSKNLVFDIKNAAYVLLDDMVITSGKGSQSVISVTKSKGVRVRNCDISKWGRVGIPLYADVKGVGMYYVKNARGRYYAVNYDGAIYIKEGSKDVVVERCYIHDPYSRANSWYYSHPAGPQAVICAYADSTTVLRYNDFIGSDLHRFNDAVEGPGNFYCTGGINRDADVYGNYMIYCNDDCIEIDGGQQNVRCFWNHFESALCGVSIQGCMTSPVYVFENMFAGMGDEFELTNTSIKTSTNNGPDATAFIFNNTMIGQGSGLRLLSTLKCIVKNNVLIGGSQKISGFEKSPASDLENNFSEIVVKGSPEGVASYKNKLQNTARGNYASTNAKPSVKIANFLPDGGNTGAFVNSKVDLPYRPIPVTLDRTRIENVVVKNGVATPGTVKITATVGGSGFQSAYTIRQNDVFDWFEVTPANGVFKSGEKVTFTVKFKPEKMKKLHNYRGAFLIRLANGFSRVVAVRAKTDFVQAFKLEKPGEKAFYFDAFSPKVTKVRGKGKAVAVINKSDKLGVEGKTITPSQKLIYEYKLDVPEDGRYYIMLHGYGNDGVARLYASVNGSKFAVSEHRVKPYSGWTMVMPGRKQGRRAQHYDLKKGICTLKIRAANNRLMHIDGIALIDNPESFEPKQ